MSKPNSRITYNIQKNAINLPEPFASAVGHYFSEENIQKLDWSQIEDLKRDLVIVALNHNDGNQTHAAKQLNTTRTNIFEMKRRLKI